MQESGLSAFCVGIANISDEFMIHQNVSFVNIYFVIQNIKFSKIFFDLLPFLCYNKSNITERTWLPGISDRKPAVGNAFAQYRQL